MKAIDYKKIDISAEEYKYYQELIKTLGDDGAGYFRGLFEVDGRGFITTIRTNKNIPWAVLVFLQQIQINQRLRVIDEQANVIRDLNSRLKVVENKLRKSEKK